MSTTYAGKPANFPDAITIPAADLVRAASLAVPLEGLADATANLVAGWHAVEIAHFAADDPTSAHAQVGDECTRAFLTDTGVALTLAGGLLAGDVVEVEVVVQAVMTMPTTGTRRGFLQVRVGSTTSDKVIPEATVYLPPAAPPGASKATDVALHTYVPIAADVAAPVDVALQGRIETDGTDIAAHAPAALVVTVWRRTT